MGYEGGTKIMTEIMKGAMMGAVMIAGGVGYDEGEGAHHGVLRLLLPDQLRAKTTVSTENVNIV
jgi:hypothetical protein